MNAVQDTDRCIEGLHVMHTDDAMLARGTIRPFHAGHWSNLGSQIRQVGAPNQLN